MTKIPFNGRVLIIGCGAVSQCLQPLLLRHLDMNFTRLTVMDFEDRRQFIPDTLAAGAHYVQEHVTPDNLAYLLGLYAGPGDLVIDLAWNIGAIDILQWCHDHNVMYINTSVELWNPYFTANDLPVDRTLYTRHMAIRDHIRRWSEPGATAVLEHGANPGLVSHWTKVALRDITLAMLERGLGGERRSMLERALDDDDFARLAMFTGTKVIHISERDTQIGSRPKEVNEFVNTWSVAGFYEEGIAPAEMGWGTHERRLPEFAHTHSYGPGNQICLAQMGINTYVRSWVPMGEIIGMAVRHGNLHLPAQDRPVFANRGLNGIDGTLGSFLGAWLGGKLYVATGSYNVVWYLTIALGVFGALINLPVRENAIPRGALEHGQPEGLAQLDKGRTAELEHR